MSDEELKTRPWTDDEYLRVDGQRVVYDANLETGITAVHLPGGRTAALTELRDEGRTITMPWDLRIW